VSRGDQERGRRRSDDTWTLAAVLGAAAVLRVVAVIGQQPFV
jgi:hypothetical protein